MRTIIYLLGFAFFMAPVQGLYAFADGDVDIIGLYTVWKEQFITSNGSGGDLRVIENEDRQTTVSEGQGYGMLLALYNNDRQTFDKLWLYAKRYLNERGVMHWQIDQNGMVIGRNGATDGDEDIAYALLAAHTQWGNYEAVARAYIDAIYAHEVERGTYVLKPGDVWGGSDITNPSYCAPAYYRAFAKFTGENGWLDVLDRCYSVIEKASNKTTGLVPEWTTATGGIAYNLTHNKNRDHFSYNAIRVPWRIAIDWVWNGEPRAYAIADRMTNFFDAQSSLSSGYMLSGAPLVSYFDTTFIAGITAGTLASDNSFFRKKMTTLLNNTTSSSYYGATLRMLSLLFITNNFPDLARTETTPPRASEALPEMFAPKEAPTETIAEVLTPDVDYAIFVANPENGSTISGEKKIKAYIDTLSLDEYEMTYSVDGHFTRAMSDAVGTFKQAKIQFDEWNWNGAGPYTVILTARNTGGEVIGTKQITLYVKH